MTTLLSFFIILLSLILLFFKLRKIYYGNFINRLGVNHAMVKHPNKVDFFNNSPSFYYADFTKCILNKPHFITSKNIFKIGGISDETSFLNICGICEFAIINLEKYLTSGNIESFNIFQSNLEWIYENATLKNKLPYWHYNYNHGIHKAPWASAISQGMAISVLVRGYVSLKDKKYLDMAVSASKTLILPIHDGGFKYCYDNFKCWFEESENNSHILNGHIYALLGIYDLYRCTQDNKFKELFLEGVIDIKNNIHFFDLGFSSRYDAIQHYPSDNSYHKIHIVLFEILAQLTQDSFFEKKAIEWNKVYKSRYLKILGFFYTINLTINTKIISHCIKN